MRLDLYLKLSRLIKRRTVAQAMCNAGRVLVNGSEAKASRAVKPGDRVSIHLPSKTVEIEIIALPEKGRGFGSGDAYRVTSEIKR